MSVELPVRIFGAIMFGIGGTYLGTHLAELAGDDPYLWAGVFTMVGALVGLIVTPYITTRPIRSLRAMIAQVSARSLLSALIGLIIGLIIAALISFPLSLLPERGSGDSSWPVDRNILLDTSVIIDGRVADIARTGFLFGSMLVPSFVLNELQHIADSSDSLRRQRGRRGLDILNQLQKDDSISFRITDLDVEGVRSVDDKLVILAKQLRCPVLTNDYNLNRVAELQGVLVLNINELANAVKAVYLPGETIDVQVIQEGKEVDQGVGYLEDGTMVVVENGKEYIGEIIPVVVTKVLQTAAGRMIFSKPSSSNNNAHTMDTE
ncbi:MAG: TRAM domain-containing protein [Anaerolineales bacterium]